MSNEKEQPVVERRQLAMLASYYYHNRTFSEYTELYLKMRPFLDAVGLHQLTMTPVNEEIKDLVDSLWPKIENYYMLKDIQKKRKKYNRKEINPKSKSKKTS